MQLLRSWDHQGLLVHIAGRYMLVATNEKSNKFHGNDLSRLVPFGRK